jgi:hypothetical protein
MIDLILIPAVLTFYATFLRWPKKLEKYCGFEVLKSIIGLRG